MTLNTRSCKSFAHDAFEFSMMKTYILTELVLGFTIGEITKEMMERRAGNIRHQNMGKCNWCLTIPQAVIMAKERRLSSYS